LKVILQVGLLLAASGVATHCVIEESVISRVAEDGLSKRESAL
jgi:hypothetical protein